MIKPDLVLRLGVAGNRDLPAEMLGSLQSRLLDMFSVLDTRLAELAPGVPVRGPDPELVLTKYYSSEKPILRLVSGLADGADQEASELLRQQASEHVRHELAAVLPFDRQTYREHSPVNNKVQFDELLGACRYVYELDGRYLANPNPDKDDPKNDIAKKCRGRAYRAQSAVLLRQSDLLIAIADPKKEGRAGGTRGTMNQAVDMGIPVLFLPLDTEGDPGGGGASLAYTRVDLDEALSNFKKNDDWKTALAECITDLIADPLSARPGHHTVAGPGDESESAKLQEEELSLLDEFFSDSTPRMRLRRQIWEAFDSLFKKKKKPKPTSPEESIEDLRLSPFKEFRKRATDLNSNYSGLYRGTFLVNYVLAVVAVALAVVSLIWLMPALDSAATEQVNPSMVPHDQTPRQSGETLPPVKLLDDSPLPLWLLLLAVGKLLAVVVILGTTHAANHKRWNDKAVDYRYLAERLRTMYYLPRVGSYRSPPPSSALYTSRILRQSVVDWLFQVIVRHAAPIGTLDASKVSNLQPVTVHPDIPGAVQAIGANWMGYQINYHHSNSKKLGGMSKALEHLTHWVNWSVIIVVIVDILIILIEIFHLLPPKCEHRLHAASPLLIAIAAVLPAALASLNGIRFQSECARLADRSGHMEKILITFQSRARKLHEEISTTAPELSAGSWTLDAITLADKCAGVTLDEAAEWSVLYAKELAHA